MKFTMLILAKSIAVMATARTTLAFVTKYHSKMKHIAIRSNVLLYAEKPVGIFFGTSTGSTEEAAHLIAAEFGSDVAAGPFEIDDAQGSVAEEFAKYDALVVGTPTWNTGADMERSGTGWDEIYYSEMQELSISGKKVAVFGLGDSVSYSENFADATGELHDVFEALGCKMLGYTSQEGYEHESSKSIRGESFCGLLLDAVNQEEMTEERVKNWVSNLITEGILEGYDAASPPVVISVAEQTHVVEVPKPANGVSKAMVELEPDDTITYIAHYNPRTDKTMWISNDGRSSYVTNGAP